MGVDTIVERHYFVPSVYWVMFDTVSVWCKLRAFWTWLHIFEEHSLLERRILRSREAVKAAAYLAIKVIYFGQIAPAEHLVDGRGLG